MNLEFHVKPFLRRPSLGRLRPLQFQLELELELKLRQFTAMAMYCIAALLLPGAASAAVYKCTGSDGKTSFSDQPCESGKSVTMSQDPPRPPTAKPKEASTERLTDRPTEQPTQDTGEAARSAARDRIRAAQTPQCLAMGDRFTSVVESGARGIPPAEFKAMMDRLEQQCGAQGRAAISTENARNEARQKQLIVDEECKEKRRVLAERRPKLTSLGSDDKKAFAAVEADVARVCR